MRHLYRHTTLNSGYFGYFRSQKYYRVFENFNSNNLCFGTSRNVLQPGGWPRIQLKCVKYLKEIIYQCVDNLMFF